MGNGIGKETRQEKGELIIGDLLILDNVGIYRRGVINRHSGLGRETLQISLEETSFRGENLRL